MIGFFPQLYPDELWYGAIMRYHLHAGIAYWSDTLQLLFPDCRTYPKVGELLPNTTMQQLQRVLPEGTLDLRELALYHSLFRFRLLFLSADRKSELLARFCEGQDIAPSLLTIRKKLHEHPLRFCPLCAQEDRKQYGEACWHTEHQIHLLPLCPKHNCRLMEAEQKPSMVLSRQLVTIPPEHAKPDEQATETELALTKLLHQWYRFPLERQANRNSDTLDRAAENAGLLGTGNVNRLAWDKDKTYARLVETFGQQIVQQVFGLRLTTAHLRRLRKLEIAHTEEYALLCILLGLDAESLFSDKVIPLHLQEQMQALARQDRQYSKHSIAEQLGIQVGQVASYAARFGIAPFWVQSGSPVAADARKEYTVTIHLSETEKQELDGYMLQNHFSAYSHVLRHFMMQGLKAGEEGTA